MWSRVRGHHGTSVWGFVVRGGSRGLLEAGLLGFCRPSVFHHIVSVFPAADINECLSISAPCPVGQTCINTEGSYTCQKNVPNCGRGYHLNEEGTRCVGWY